MGNSPLLVVLAPMQCPGRVASPPALNDVGGGSRTWPDLILPVLANSAAHLARSQAVSPELRPLNLQGPHRASGRAPGCWHDVLAVELAAVQQRPN